MSNYYTRKLPVLVSLSRQYIWNPELAIVGSVHRENVGDMALSRSVAQVADSLGVNAELQLLGEGLLGLHRWPKGKVGAVVAGGALGREKRMRPLVDQYGSQPQKVTLVGMSFWSIDDLSRRSINFLKRTAYISCRNRTDITRLSEIGVENAVFAYDNAFALDLKKPRRKHKRLGINVVPRHMRDKGKGVYVPTDNNPQFGPAYMQMMRSVAQSYLERGWEVHHIPFTEADRRYAAFMFEGIDVQHHKYRHQVEPVFESVAQCNRFIGTRYHAHIFALKARVPFFSVSYASKCALLQDDLDMPVHARATRADVVDRSVQIAEYFTDSQGFRLEKERLKDIEDGVRENIESAIQSLLRCQ